jgi:putative ABC transport system permease protein
MIFMTAFRNLFRNVRRTIAVLLTVALGAGALFCFEGFINGVLKEYAESTIHAQHGNGQINTQGYRDSVFEKPWKHWVTNGKEVEEFVLQQEGVSHVFPRVSISGMLYGKKATIVGQGQGTRAQEESLFFNALNVEEGKMLSNEEDGILLGKGLAKALDVKPGDAVTLYVKSSTGGISKGEFQVTGIFHTGSFDFDNRVFRIQLDKAQKLLKTKNVESISVGLQDHRYWEKVAQAVEGKFPKLETASFAVLDKIYYQHSVDWLSAQFHVVQVIILSIVLLGIFNTVSASILERKQEIGNLRANGESISHVMQLIILEGSLLGIFGSLLGLGLTYLIAKGFLHQGILMPPGPGSTRQFFITFRFEWIMCLSSLSLSILAAAVSSFLAGFKVAKMPIARALRA